MQIEVFGSDCCLHVYAKGEQVEELITDEWGEVKVKLTNAEVSISHLRSEALEIKKVLTQNEKEVTT